MQTTSSHLPALRQRGVTYTRAQGRQLKWQNLHICNRKTAQGWCINALIQMTQKLNPFPLHLTSCHLISQRRLRTSILSLLQYFSPVDAENTSTGREGVMPGWTWAPQGIERCLWQEAVYSSVPNSCCLQLFPSFSTPLSIICELREKPQNWLQTGQKSKGARSVEFHIRPSVEETHTRTNSKSTLIF